MKISVINSQKEPSTTILVYHNFLLYCNSFSFSFWATPSGAQWSLAALPLGISGETLWDAGIERQLTVCKAHVLPAVQGFGP